METEFITRPANPCGVLPRSVAVSRIYACIIARKLGDNERSHLWDQRQAY